MKQLELVLCDHFGLYEHYIRFMERRFEKEKINYSLVRPRYWVSYQRRDGSNWNIEPFIKKEQLYGTKNGLVTILGELYRKYELYRESIPILESNNYVVRYLNLDWEIEHETY